MFIKVERQRANKNVIKSLLICCSRCFLLFHFTSSGRRTTQIPLDCWSIHFVWVCVASILSSSSYCYLWPNRLISFFIILIISKLWIHSIKKWIHFYDTVDDSTNVFDIAFDIYSRSNCNKLDRFVSNMIGVFIKMYCLVYLISRKTWKREV